MRVLLVRHGRTPSNVAQVLDTAYPGADLDEVGREQAGTLVERLAEHPIDAIYVSDLPRTQQTAAPLAQARGLVPVVHPGLREIQAGAHEMSPDWAPFVQTILAWRADPTVRMPGAGGETGHEVLTRMDGVFRDARAAGHATIVAVTHGAVLGAWLAARAANLPTDFLRTADRSNTVVVDVHGEPHDHPHTRPWQVARWGETSLLA